MSERDVAKEALKRNYMKEIIASLNKKAELGEDSIFLSEKEEIKFNGVAINDKIWDLTRFLVVELADTKAELWLQTRLVQKS